MPTPSDLREAISGLSVLAARDLRSVWGQVNNPTQARAALEDVLPPLVSTYSTAAATVAADWYDDLRSEQNIDGRFFAIVNEIDDAGSDVLARWSVGPLFDTEPDWDRAFTLAEGGTQLRIANAARSVVMQSSDADPQARGWQRSASMGCAFCQMLAARGAVYSRGSVDFGAHDHCKCVAVPAFGGRPLAVQPYTPTSQRITDADRARTRKWMRENLPGIRG